MLYDNLTQEQKQRVAELEKHKKQTAITVEINRNNNEIIDQYTVIETIKVKYLSARNKYEYIYYNIAICNKCGFIKKLSTSYSTNRNFYNKCMNCNIIENQKSLVGYENDKYKVIDYSHKIKKHLYYKCICKNCNQEIIVRKDNIFSTIKSDSCPLCRKNDGNNKIKHSGNHHKPSIKSVFNRYLYIYKRNAKSRGYNWELTDDEFELLIKQPCHYCGAEPKIFPSLEKYNKTNSPYLVNGVDRKDNTLGYTKDNCVTCCPRCNQMKMSESYNDFLEHIHKISHKHKRATTISKESTSQTTGDGSGGHPEMDDDIVCTV